MIDHMTLYDTIYALVAGEGRGEALLGGCGPLAREAFRRSLAGDEFPIVWFEVPMRGNPRFDLHVALGRDALRAGVEFAEGAGNGYDELLRWYEECEPGGAGLAFAYDVSDGRIEAPAIHVNVNGKSLQDPDTFFRIAGGEDAPPLYQDFVGRLPQGWRVWYAGVHPGRPGSPVRVDCFVEQELQEAYAAEPALLERDLRSCGFAAIGPELPQLTKLVCTSEFALELQFDVMRDGSVGPTLGLSASFPIAVASKTRPLFEQGGAAAELLGSIQGMGLADDRWRQLPGAIFTKLVKLPESTVVLYNMPTFVKVRMRDGALMDAKLYLQAGAQELPRG